MFHFSRFFTRNCLPVISCHILHFNATHTHSHQLAIMANLNFYHVYKQTIRASSSQPVKETGKRESGRERGAKVKTSSQPFGEKKPRASYNICISISYAACRILFPTTSPSALPHDFSTPSRMQIQSILNISVEPSALRKLCGITMKMFTCLTCFFFLPFGFFFCWFLRCISGAPSSMQRQKTFHITYLQI